jgi:hypothetical protein
VARRGRGTVRREPQPSPSAEPPSTGVVAAEVTSARGGTP